MKTSKNLNNLISDEDKKIWEDYTKGIKKSDKSKNYSFTKFKKVKISNFLRNSSQYYFKTSLDLHGYTVDRAYEELYLYLLEAKSQQLKFVSIITGKGKEEKQDTLNKLVPRWLNEKPMKNLIVSYEFLKHNPGELKVKLRRKKKAHK